MHADAVIYRGIVGRIVKALGPHTEADPVGIAAQTLVAMGSCIGRGPHIWVGETAHHTVEYLLIVGPTATSRKGDSGHVALRVWRDADPDWARRIRSGLVSGEGLIHHVRDASDRRDKDGEPIDAGAGDKRLLAMESEYARVLRTIPREGCTLSAVLRDAWDAPGVLATLGKQAAETATGAHISLIAHATEADLRRYLTDTEAANGYGNRHLVVCVRRVRLLPDPGRAPADIVAQLVDEARQLLDWARRVGEMRRSPAARALWHGLYPQLSIDRPGLAGAMLARAEAHVMRLSMLYALADHSELIDTHHLESALALWDVCEASVRELFRGRTGDDVADRILEALGVGDHMSITEIRDDVFRRHVPAAVLRAALELLCNLGEIRMEHERTEGRDRIVITRVDRTRIEATDGAAHAAV